MLTHNAHPQVPATLTDAELDQVCGGGAGFINFDGGRPEVILIPKRGDKLAILPGSGAMTVQD
jgi:hypothetical protein